MKLSIVNGFSVSGRSEAILFDSDTQESRRVTWAKVTTGRFLTKQWIEGETAYGILSDRGDEASGPNTPVSAAFIGVVGDNYPMATLFQLPTGVAAQGVVVGVTGLECFVSPVPGTPQQLASINLSNPPPVFVTQPDEGYILDNRTLMRFKDGHSRIVYVDADNYLMSLSTPLGNGQPLREALSTPYTPPVQDPGNMSQLLGDMAVCIDNLGRAAAAAGLGNYTLAQPWFINTYDSSPCPGEIRARDTEGNLRACFAVELMALTIYEINVDSRNISESVYTSAVEFPSDWFSPSYRLSLGEKPGVFWRSFVRAFEEAPA